MRKFLALCLAVVLLLPGAVYAQDTEAVVISYSRAVELAAATLQDMEEIFKDMREIQDELRDEIRELERGDQRRETISALAEELSTLELQLMYAQLTHEMMHGSIALSVENILASMASPDDAENLAASLQSAISGMMAVQGMGGNMAMMQNRMHDILDEISLLQDSVNVRDITDGLRDAIEAIDYQMDVMRLGHEQSALVVENTLRSLIIAVTELETMIETMTAGLAQTQENLRRVNIRREFGLASHSEVRAATHAVTVGQLALTQRQASLYNARNSLNYLLGQPLSQYTTVAFTRDLPEIPEDLDEHIAEIIPTTPPIRRLQMIVNTEYEALRAYRGFDRDTREELREAYQRATQNRDAAMRTMEAAMRRAYNDLTNLQTQRESQLLEVVRAQQALEVAQTNLALGRITRHDVTQAELAVFVAEQAIESTLNQQWLLAFRLQNPSLLH